MAENRNLKSRIYIIGKYSVSESDLEDFLNEKKDLIVNVDNQELINIRSKKFRLWVKEKKENKKTLNPYEILERKALEAKLKSEIHKAEIKRIQAEKENMDLLTQRNELINHADAKYYYFEYMAKINIEIFRCDKPLIDFLIEQLQQKLTTEDMHFLKTEFKTLFENTIGAAIKDVITQQKKELDEWTSGKIIQK
jgi:hypothetical protein